MSESNQHEVANLCSKLHLKSSTKHLAQLICSHYFFSLDNICTILKGREAILAGVLIAAKIRERDIECPTVSVMAKTGRTIC